MMKRTSFRVMAALLLMGGLGSGFAEESLSGPFPRSAQGLLNDVIARLPDVPLLIEADLLVRHGGTGEQDEQIGVSMELDWWADPPTAQYTLRDRFAAPLAHLSITWEGEGRTSYRYFEGDPLAPAPLPELQAPILGTDLSWVDLSLSFLWWRSGAILGAESVRSRDCLVVDLPAPPDAPLELGGVRLWIDPKIGMLLQAESFDLRGERIRRMEVKSFKKINDRWVIKDITFRRYPSTGQSTLLRVRNVEERERFVLPER